MTTPKLTTICDYGEFSATTKRCRKHAQFAIGLRVHMGYQVGANGDLPLYRMEVQKRCQGHVEAHLNGTILGRLTMTEYNRKLQEAVHAT